MQENIFKTQTSRDEYFVQCYSCNAILPNDWLHCIIKVGALVQIISLNKTFWTFKWINSIKMEDYYADYEENYSMQLRFKCWAYLGRRKSDRSFKVSKDITTFGKSVDCKVILDQHEDKVTREEIAALSQYHFTIERVNTEKIFIEDHSSSGTYVNGSLIGKGNKGHLRSGDTITLGENIMVFKFFMLLPPFYP